MTKIANKKDSRPKWQHHPQSYEGRSQQLKRPPPRTRERCLVCSRASTRPRMNLGTKGNMQGRLGIRHSIMLLVGGMPFHFVLRWQSFPNAPRFPVRLCRSTQQQPMTLLSLSSGLLVPPHFSKSSLRVSYIYISSGLSSVCPSLVHQVQDFWKSRWLAIDGQYQSRGLSFLPPANTSSCQYIAQ